MAMTQARKSLVTMLGLLVASGAVAAYAYFGAYKADEAQKKQDEQNAKIFDFDKAKVKSVSLNTKKATSKIDRTEDGWKFVAPVEARADKSAVDAIVDKLFDLSAKNLNEGAKEKIEPSYVVSSNKADAEQY